MVLWPYSWAVILPRPQQLWVCAVGTRRSRML